MIRSRFLIKFLAWLVAATFVVELQVPGLPLSIEEIVLVAISFVFLAMGLRIRFSPLLVALGFTVFLVRANHAMFTGDFGAAALALAQTGIQFFVFSVFYSAILFNKSSGLNAMIEGLIWLALASSVVIFFQFIGILPNVAVIEGQLSLRSRPTGLHVDANFSGYSLALALALLPISRFGPTLALLLGGAVFVGLVLTESRMGLLLVLIAWSYQFLANGAGSRERMRSSTRVIVLSAGLVGLGSAALFSFMNPGGVGSGGVGNLFLLERFTHAYATLSQLSVETLIQAKGYQGDSTMERLMLAYAGILVWLENFWIGVGPGIAEAVDAHISVTKATHNTFIDNLAIGGVAGLLFILLTLSFIALAISARRHCADPKLLRASRLALMIAVIGSFFLNVSFWLPVTLVAAARAGRPPEAYAARNGRGGRLVESRPSVSAR